MDPAQAETRDEAEVVVRHDAPAAKRRELLQQRAALFGRRGRLAQVEQLQSGPEEGLYAGSLSGKEVRLRHYDQFHLRRAMISSATFFPLISMPPKMGPMRGVPETAEAAIPQT